MLGRTRSLFCSTFRTITIAAVAAVLGSAMPAADALAADTESGQTQTETREVVDLKLKIAANGRAVGQIVQLVELDTDTSLALSTDGHEHAVAIKVRKADEDGRKLAVTVGYMRDGEAVLETVTVEAAAKKAKVVRSEGGEVALSLELSPKVVSVEELPKPGPTRPRVEIIEGTDDPLAGVD